MSDGTATALFTFLGIVVSSSTAIVVAIINKSHTEKEKKSNDPKTKAQARQTLKKLNWWRAGIIVLMLFTLTLLIYLVWFPGSENHWLVRIHTALAELAGAGGLGTLVFALPRFQKKQYSSATETWRAAITIFFALLFLVPFAALGPQFRNWQTLSPSTKLMTAGFDLMNSEDYERAMAAAEECTNDFHLAAIRVEETMMGKQLPTGKVSPADMEAILNNGVLNDVGACYWITGRSAEKLHRANEAKAAYNKVLKYPHARVWDSRGWFWSPAEDAKDRLQDLQ
jgi:hypothetical protein